MINLSNRTSTRCYVLDIDDLDADCITGIAPYYQKKARKKQSRKAALAELGVGLLLAKVLTLTTDEALVIDEYGRPSLADESCEIGISHAGNLVILAASSCRIGIDVEPLPERIADYHYLALKRAYGNLLDDKIEGELTPYRFCRLWTRVEAAVKLDGRGLRLDPRENPQVFTNVHFSTYEYKKHVLTVATYEANDIKIMKG